MHHSTHLRVAHGSRAPGHLPAPRNVRLGRGTFYLISIIALCTHIVLLVFEVLVLEIGDLGSPFTLRIVSMYFMDGCIA